MPRATFSSEEWTSIGRDLLVSLAGEPRGRWADRLCDQLRAAIRRAALRPGVRLPSTRALAADLGLSRGVVVEVYERLAAEGYLDARGGSGTRVAGALARAALEPGADPGVRGPAADPNPGLPDVGLFPRGEWLRAYRAALSELDEADLRYGDPRGHASLRSVLADYLGRVRGVVATPERILVTGGFAQALAILARVLPALGIEAIGVEEPGSTGAREQLASWGIDTPAIPVDDEGLRVDALEASGARAVLVTPAHQYPTGVVLSPGRRQQLLSWCEQGDRYVVEDDYDAEFRYDRSPVGSLQPLAPGRVLSGSSVSKTLSPALRVGWLVLPPRLLEAATAAKMDFDIASPTVTQVALAGLMASGAFDRHLRRSRREYRRRRRHVAQRLASHLPEGAVTGLDAGLHLCIRLPAGVADVPLARALRHRGVPCRALGWYHQTPPDGGGIVLDLVGTADAHLDLLVDALRAAR